MDLEMAAISRVHEASEISLAYYGLPLMICISGGKDSDVTLQIVKHAGIPFEVQHSLTTADAPQTVYHVREQFRQLELEGVRCILTHPTYKGQRISMWTLIPQKLMPPTMKMRYCCAVLKETAGANRAIVTGVRWAESTARKERGIFESITSKKEDKAVILPEPENTQLVLSESLFLNNDNDLKRRWMEHCKLQGKMVCNPLIDWPDRVLFDYIHSEKLQLNPLYAMGFDRVGCIGCPMARNKRYFEFDMFPTYKQTYIHSFDRMLKMRRNHGKDDQDWKTGEDVFRWWMRENPYQLEFPQAGMHHLPPAPSKFL